MPVPNIQLKWTTWITTEEFYASFLKSVANPSTVVKNSAVEVIAHGLKMSRCFITSLTGPAFLGSLESSFGHFNFSAIRAGLQRMSAGNSHKNLFLPHVQRIQTYGSNSLSDTASHLHSSVGKAAECKLARTMTGKRDQLDISLATHPRPNAANSALI